MFIIIRYSNDLVNHLREVMLYCKKVGISTSFVSFIVIGESILVMGIKVSTDGYVCRIPHAQPDID